MDREDRKAYARQKHLVNKEIKNAENGCWQVEC